MIDENNTLFNNFVETVERYELLSQTQRLIFCFSGGKDATIGLHFLRKYLEENNIGMDALSAKADSTGSRLESG